MHLVINAMNRFRLPLPILPCSGLLSRRDVLSVGAISEAMSEKNRLWRLVDSKLTVVIDPAAWQRTAITATETVATELMRLGWNVVPGQNDRLAGVLELQGRCENDALFATENVLNWHYERERWLVATDEETGEQRPKSGKGTSFTTIGPDHLMDPSRYGAMYRAFAAVTSSPFTPAPQLYVPGKIPALGGSRPHASQAPMGNMS